MKIYFYLFALIFLAEFYTPGQVQQAVNISPPAPYKIVQRGANSRIWQNTTYEKLASGQLIPHIYQYTEMASGLCYQKDGQWLDSQEQINILSDGTAAATNGQHQVYFPNDIFNGVITLMTPDGLRIQKRRPLGISFDDGSNIVLIAELTNSVGELINSNQVIYTNAFIGVNADLIYTYKRGSFEQDVVFRNQPPAPENWGLCSTNTRLQLLTEFFNVQEPIITPRASSPRDKLQDNTLSFGKMSMIRGKAFLSGDERIDLHKVPVYKSWQKVSGRGVSG